MDRVALAGWVVVGLVPALGWWAAHALSEQAVGFDRLGAIAEVPPVLTAGFLASGVSPGQSALAHLDVAVVLPLATRAGDGVGPGWARP